LSDLDVEALPVARVANPGGAERLLDLLDGLRSKPLVVAIRLDPYREGNRLEDDSPSRVNDLSLLPVVNANDRMSNPRPGRFETGLPEKGAERRNGERLLRRGLFALFTNRALRTGRPAVRIAAGSAVSERRGGRFGLRCHAFIITPIFRR
jgi:hypothetical protein